MLIRKAETADLYALLHLYTHLHGNTYPDVDSRIEKIWNRIIKDENHHILLGFIDNELIASCVIVIVENLTHEQLPYALIENVITHPNHRSRGYASMILAAAKEVAVQKNCYKIMLMTGSKKEATLAFYRKAGFNSEDKTAFVQWL